MLGEVASLECLSGSIVEVPAAPVVYQAGTSARSSDDGVEIAAWVFETTRNCRLVNGAFVEDGRASQIVD
jgi:hypothetical protein